MNLLKSGHILERGHIVVEENYKSLVCPPEDEPLVAETVVIE